MRPKTVDVQQANAELQTLPTNINRDGRSRLPRRHDRRTGFNECRLTPESSSLLFRGGRIQTIESASGANRRANVKAVNRLRRMMPAYKMPIALLLDGHSLVGLRIQDEDLTTTTHEKNVRTAYFFETYKSRFVFIALMGDEEVNSTGVCI